MKLSVSIMAHPVRRRLVDELLASLDRDTPVAWAQNPEPSSDMRVVWRTARAAWELADPNADWHMLLQDDAIAAPDLIAGLEKGLEHVPAECVVQPYLGAERPQRFHIVERVARARNHDAAWFVMQSMIWGVAIVVPTRSIEGMLEWCSQPRFNTMSDDMRVGRYYRDVLGWTTWYPWPSPVDHRDTESILGHRVRGRVAHRFMEHSVLAHDWTGPIFHAPAIYARQQRKGSRMTDFTTEQPDDGTPAPPSTRADKAEWIAYAQEHHGDTAAEKRTKAALIELYGEQSSPEPEATDTTEPESAPAPAPPPTRQQSRGKTRMWRNRTTGRERKTTVGTHLDQHLAASNNWEPA